MSLPALTVPGWTLATLGGLTLLAQIGVLIDPTQNAKQHHLDHNTARLIAFILVLINIYDIKGAVEDDWLIYKFSLISRAVATLLFYSFGKVWRNVMLAEFATLVIFGIAMYVA